MTERLLRARRGSVPTSFITFRELNEPEPSTHRHHEVGTFPAQFPREEVEITRGGTPRQTITDASLQISLPDYLCTPSHLRHIYTPPLYDIFRKHNPRFHLPQSVIVLDQIQSWTSSGVAYVVRLDQGLRPSPGRS
jgi:hypothetical protein